MVCFNCLETNQGTLVPLVAGRQQQTTLVRRWGARLGAAGCMPDC